MAERTLLALLGLAGHICASMSSKRIALVMRYDDYSSVSHTELEIQIIEAFRERGLPVTFGVVPYTRSDVTDEEPAYLGLISEKAAILTDAISDGTVDVAQHGVSHEAMGVSEFDGVAYDVQLRRIADGKKVLEDALGAPVTTFIPPWNSYDANTLLVLEELGFECISADVAGTVGDSTALRFLPTTKQELSELRKSVLMARVVADREPVVVLVFHSCDFEEGAGGQRAMTANDLAELLDWIASQKDVQAMSASQALQTIGDLSPARCLANLRYQTRLPLVPSFVHPRAVYLSTGAAKTMRGLVKLSGLLLCALPLALIALFYYHMAARVR